MDSVDIGEAAADFVAAATFDGARHGFVLRMGDRDIGYYRDDGATKKAHARSSQQPQSQQSTLPVMPPPPPRPPPPSLPPRPPPTQPAANQPAQPASTSFGSSSRSSLKSWMVAAVLQLSPKRSLTLSLALSPRPEPHRHQRVCHQLELRRSYIGGRTAAAASSRSTATGHGRVFWVLAQEGLVRGVLFS